MLEETGTGSCFWAVLEWAVLIRLVVLVVEVVFEIELEVVEETELRNGGKATTKKYPRQVRIRMMSYANQNEGVTNTLRELYTDKRIQPLAPEILRQATPQ